MLRILKKIFQRHPRPEDTAIGGSQSFVSIADDFMQKGKDALGREEYELAIEHYTIVISNAPNRIGGYIGLGYTLTQLGRWDDVIGVLKQALIVDASNADSLFMLGHAHVHMGHWLEAEQAWHRAYELFPDLEHLYSEYGLLLFRQGKLGEALELMKKGVERFPQNSNIQFYLGNLLISTGAVASAIKHYRAAETLGDRSPGLYVSLGSALVQSGSISDAISVLKIAQELDPDSAKAASNYLLAIQYSNISRADKFAAAKAFADRFEVPLRKYWGNYPLSRSSGRRKLRVGYVSGDFRDHALAFFFEPIILQHDKNNFEITCYYTHPLFDEVSRRIQRCADRWVSCHDVPDAALADRIRADNIDILIDLSGHTGYNRLLTFARKPAPIQITWLGYQATTGLRAIDYRITDEALDPVGASEQFHSEKLIRLPSSATFSPSPDSPPVNPLPAAESSVFTYGCLNNPSKISDEVIYLWSRILIAHSSARLMLGGATEALTEQLSIKFEKYNISRSRLIFQPQVGIIDYLKLHHQIDLALDTFPYNGGTTTYHSLWMGVPVVVLEGNSTLSNVGVAVMRGMELSQFCADTSDGYVEKALYFSSHLNELSLVRQSLRDTMGRVTEQLAGQVTKSLEEAMQKCWQEYSNNT